MSNLEEVKEKILTRYRRFLKILKLTSEEKLIEKDLEKLISIASKCLEDKDPYRCYVDKIKDINVIDVYIPIIISVYMYEKSGRDDKDRYSIFDTLTQLAYIMEKLKLQVNNLDMILKALTLRVIIGLIYDLCQELQITSTICLLTDNLEVLNTAISINEVRKRLDTELAM